MKFSSGSAATSAPFAVLVLLFMAVPAYANGDDNGGGWTKTTDSGQCGPDTCDQPPSNPCYPYDGLIAWTSGSYTSTTMQRQERNKTHLIFNYKATASGTAATLRTPYKYNEDQRINSLAPGDTKYYIHKLLDRQGTKPLPPPPAGYVPPPPCTGSEMPGQQCVLPISGSRSGDDWYYTSYIRYDTTTGVEKRHYEKSECRGRSKWDDDRNERDD